MAQAQMLQDNSVESISKHFKISAYKHKCLSSHPKADINNNY